MRSNELSVKLLFVKTELTFSPHAAAEFIRAGGIVAFPTETVYGLGADVFNETAIAKIFNAKMRPPDNPLIAHVGNVDQISQLVSAIPGSARSFIEAFFPGPLTLVLERSEKVPMIATSGLGTIGVRMPGSSLANEFLLECGVPVVAPSANLSGRPSPTTWQAVFEDLDGRIDCILQGNPTDIGLESTVVDCTTDPPAVLRAGAVSIEELRNVISGTIVSTPGSPDHTPKSPGMRHKHYAPKAEVVLVNSPMEISANVSAGFIGLDAPDGKFARMMLCSSVEDYAKNLFQFFRDCDNAGVRTIYCQTVDETGMGTALMDRLRRAAER